MYTDALRFVVMRLLNLSSKRGKDKRGVLQALGGTWDPELDGGDPERYERVWVWMIEGDLDKALSV